MFPVSQLEALVLNDEGYQVYRIYPDDTESALDERSEIAAEPWDCYAVQISDFTFCKGIEDFLPRPKDDNDESTSET